MASSLPPASIHQHHQSLQQPATNSAISFPRLLAGNYTTTHFLSASLLLNRSRPLSPSNPNSRCGRCPATSPRPPSSPQSEPPSDEDPFSASVPGVTYLPLLEFMEAHPQVYQPSCLDSKTQCRSFLAVLFWMSLFFWSSVWDRKNDDRSDKGSRFRR